MKQSLENKLSRFLHEEAKDGNRLVFLPAPALEDDPIYNFFISYKYCLRDEETGILYESFRTQKELENFLNDYFSEKQ